MRINQAGLYLIRRFEGLRLKAYRDPVGVWTIGYGHTSGAGAPEVIPGMIISQQQAEVILKRDLEQYEKVVADNVMVFINANQFSALVSFCYNIGSVNFRQSSALSYTNNLRFAEVPGRLALWNKAGGKVLPGLVKRRKAEGELFLTL